MRKITILMLLILLLIVSFSVTSALAVEFPGPPLPSEYWGAVTVDGTPPAAGTPVTAEINGQQFASGAVIDIGGQSYYDLIVPGDMSGTPGEKEGGTAGEPILIKVDGDEAEPALSWTSGNNTRKDIIVVLVIAVPVELAAGFNLVSVPVNLQTWQLGEEAVVGNPVPVSPSNCIQYIYLYNSTSGQWDLTTHYDGWGWFPSAELKPGIGYWFYTNGPCTLTFSGTPPGQLELPMGAGYNLMGWYSTNAGILGEEAVVGMPINVTPANSVAYIYLYNATSGQWDLTTHYDDWGWFPTKGLTPGLGYWFYTSQAGIWYHNP